MRKNKLTPVLYKELFKINIKQVKLKKLTVQRTLKAFALTALTVTLYGGWEGGA